MPVNENIIIKAIENLGGKAKAQYISPEVAKIMNEEPYPQSYKDYRSFYGTVQAKIESYCPESDNYKEGNEKLFSRVGLGVYELYNKNEITLTNDTQSIKDEIANLYFSIGSDSALEGYRQDITILSSHRNQKLAKDRKNIDNHTCQVCGFVLNISGKFVIECHHLNPLSDNNTVETSIKDLISLCPTCHRIAHLRKPPYTPDELINIIKNA